MPTTPILPYSVNLILQYISPPSQLDSPLPPHLISRSLLQRHVFLEISPENSASYLTWASPNRDRAIELLESLPKPIDDHMSSQFPVRYTSDGEATYAQVHINVSGDAEESLRLVFQWDGKDGWAYHDATLMPFPQGSHASLPEALSTAGVEDVTVHVSRGDHQVESGGEHAESGDDDDYWSSYGAHDVDDASPRFSRHRSKEGSEAGEDAYWAQYASVQGTADSTIPSPVQKNRHKLHPAPEEMRHFPAEEILPIPPASFRLQRAQNGKEPPSPHTLSRRLTALSPRHSRPPSTPGSHLESAFDAMMAEAAEARSVIAENAADEDSDTPSPPPDLEVGSRTSTSGGMDRTPEPDTRECILSPQPVKPNGASFLRPSTGEESEEGVEADVDEGVREAIRGVFRLWKATRRRDGGEAADFIQLIQEVVERP